MLEEQGKYIFGVVKVGDRGQIVLDDHLRNVVNHRICAIVKYNF